MAKLCFLKRVRCAGASVAISTAGAVNVATVVSRDDQHCGWLVGHRHGSVSEARLAAVHEVESKLG